MRVDLVFSYDNYWKDPRFAQKRPNRRGSLKQAFGDNIYRHGRDGKWRQADSHHSCEDGTPNRRNIENDTKSDRVLISQRFAYWGSSGPRVPDRFLNFQHTGVTLRITRGHRSNFPPAFVKAFVAWFEGLDQQGYLGPPFQWVKPNAAWARYPG